MTTDVLIPGACHGTWCFDDPAAALRSRGHRVLAITLTGVAERAHLARGGVNLETHVTDVLSAVAAEPEAENLVLVGHSYGGMVITVVADRIPAQTDSLVFIDALVPRDGESCWDLVNDEEQQWYLGVDDTGYGVPPMPFFDPRASAHPLASFMRPVKLFGDLGAIRGRDVVDANQWPGDSPMRTSSEKGPQRSRVDDTRIGRQAQPRARQARGPAANPVQFCVVGSKLQHVSVQWWASFTLTACQDPPTPKRNYRLSMGGSPPTMPGLPI